MENNRLAAIHKELNWYNRANNPQFIRRTFPFIERYTTEDEGFLYTNFRTEVRVKMNNGWHRIIVKDSYSNSIHDIADFLPREHESSRGVEQVAQFMHYIELVKIEYMMTNQDNEPNDGCQLSEKERWEAIGHVLESGGGYEELERLTGLVYI